MHISNHSMQVGDRGVVVVGASAELGDLGHLGSAGARSQHLSRSATHKLSILKILPAHAGRGWLWGCNVIIGQQCLLQGATALRVYLHGAWVLMCVPLHVAAGAKLLEPAP